MFHAIAFGLDRLAHATALGGFFLALIFFQSDRYKAALRLLASRCSWEVSGMNEVTSCLARHTGTSRIPLLRENFLGAAIQDFDVDIVVSLKELFYCYRFHEGEI